MSIKDNKVVQRVKSDGTVVKARPETEEAPVAVAVPLDTVAADESESEGSDVSEASFDLDADDEAGGGQENGAVLETVDGNEDEDVDLSLLEDNTSPVAKSVSVAHDEPEDAFLEVYSENCLSCKSLVPFATKKFKACHYSAGNKHCPAQSASIIIRVPLEEIVPRWLSAEKFRDFGRLSKMTALLSTKPEWYQQRVANALEEARAKKT